jgi:hypothetical protein
MSTKKSAGNEPIVLKPINLQTITIPIKGITELIVHNWSEKAKRMMLDKQMGKAVEKRPKKNPVEDAIESLHWLSQKPTDIDEKSFEELIIDGKFGFPSGGFKAAIVGACRSVDGLPMTLIKQILRVNGEYVEIEGIPRMREDMVRLETKVADIRYRAGFPEWKCKLNITFNADVITKEILVNLVNLAGMGGIGEWRPTAPKSASGSMGCFEVDAE